MRRVYCLLLTLLAVASVSCNSGALVTKQPTVTGNPPGGSPIAVIGSAPPAPLANLNPAALNFGDILVGTTFSQTVTLRNTGNGDLNVSQAVVAGSGFSITGLSLPLTVPPSQSVTFNVTFSPQVAGNAAGTVTFTTTAVNPPTVLTLSGNGVIPPNANLTPSPAGLDFGSVVVGSSPTLAVVLTNNGGTDAIISQLTMGGAAVFSLVSPPTLPLLLTPGQSVTLNVRFAPVVPGNLAGTVTITSDAPNSPNVIPLAGTAVAAVQQLTLNPTSTDFGDVNVGSSASQVVTVTNTGNTTVTISSTSVAGAGMSITPPFAVPATLTPGQSTSFTVVFAPTAAGAVNGNATLNSNAANSPHVVTLAGNGVSSTVQVLTLNPTSISFGDVIVGNNANQSVTVTNTGNAPVTISSTSVAGAGMSITPPLAVPVTLNPGQSANFNVRFAPGAAGAVNGNATLTSNATNSPHVVTLVGNGVAQVLQLGVNPTVINFGDVVVGNNSNVSGTLTNLGNVNLTVTAANVAGAGFSLNPPLALPLTLTPGQTANFTTRFAPTAAGAAAGSISFVSNAANSPTVVTLQGNGVAAPTGLLDLNPTNIDFGNVIVGNFQDAGVTATNNGAVAVTINTVTPSGAGFSLNPAPTLPIVLNPGQSANFTVRFAPAAAGAVAGSLSVVSTAVNSPATTTLAGNGLAQTRVLTVNPTNINFGSVTVGANANQNVSMTNTGNSSLTVTAANVTGAAFSIVPALGLPLTLNPGQSANFNVRFTPSATGLVNGSVSLVSNASNSPTSVTLSGTGVAAPTAQLTLNPTSFNFGNVIVGNSASQVITVTNTGTASGTVTSSSVAGAGISISPPLTVPFTLNPGQNATFTVVFAPAAPGVVNGNATLVSNATNSPHVVTLTGTGIALVRTLSVNPASLSFGNVAVGGSSSLSATMTNTGNVSLTVTAANVTGTGYSINPALALPLTLNPGQSANFTVVFSPAAAGSVAGNVALISNASNSPTNVALSGTGVAASGQLVVNPSSINFGNVVVGGPVSLPVALTNIGGASLTISTANPVGSPTFTLTGLTLPLTLAPGQTATINARFQPTASGAVNATFTFDSTANDPVLTLSGNGVTGVILLWDDSTNPPSPLTKYRVYRSTTMGGPYIRITATDLTVLTYVDVSATPGSTYFYVVTAVDTDGIESIFSNELPVVIP